MKIRSGFVSNSSSSSFIIGIGQVTDRAVFEAACKERNIDICGDVQLMTIGEIRENRPYEIDSITEDRLTVESWMYSTVSLNHTDLPDDALIAVMQMTGELDGDYAFSDDDDDGWGDMNYDLSPTDEDHTKMEVFSEACGVKNGDATGGAGRNG